MPKSQQLEQRKQRDLALERERESDKQRVFEQLDELSLDFKDNPEQIGHYIAELEIAGLLSASDKSALYQRIWESMGPTFAEQVFGMTSRALASSDLLADDIAHDSYVRIQGDRAVFTDASQYDRAMEAQQALEALAHALDIRLELARPEMRRLPDLDQIADPDVERAGKTREVLDTLAPKLGIDADQVDVRVDEDAKRETSDVGNLGLMADGTVFLDPEIYDPESRMGRHLLAHELVHVAQLENRLRGANDTPDLFQAEAEADELSATFAQTGNIEAPLASLASYDKAACAAVAMDKKPGGKTETERIPGKETEKTTKTVIDVTGAVYFVVDKHTIDQTNNVPSNTPAPEKSKEVFDSVAKTLLTYPEITKINVHAHASTTASYGYNKVLTDKRAAMAVDQLGSRGVANKRLAIGSFSENQHRAKLKIDNDKTQTEDSAYRRVDFSIAEVNGAAHKGPLTKVSREVVKTPGRTIVRTYDASGKLVKTEEVVDGEAPAGKLENDPTAVTPVAKEEAAIAKDDAMSTPEEAQASHVEQPTPTPVAGTTEEKKEAHRPRRTPTRMTPTRGKRAKTPRRYADNAIRAVAQPKAGPGGLTSTEISDRTSAQGSGERLPDNVRSQFEQSFGQSFADVRIHRGSAQATGIGATAFARGTDIHFAPGRYDTDSSSGLAVLGHELTHIVQQRSGRVSVPQGKGTHVNVEHSLESEADLLGAKAARGERVSVQGSSAGLYSRAASGEADTVQFEGGKAETSAAVEAVIGNTLLDIWATNISSTKDLFDSAVKPEQRPPASGLSAAIIGIGIDTAAMALFGPLAAAATNRGRQVLVELMNSAFKNGLNLTANALAKEDETPQSPQDFSAMWANQQREAVNKMRQQLVTLLSSQQVTVDDLRTLTASVTGEMLSSATAARTLLQQYTYAQYYHSGHATFDGKGRMLIDVWLGTDTGFTQLEAPREVTVSIAGLETAALKKLSDSFPNGVNPLDAKMAFEVRFSLMEGSGRLDHEGNEGFDKKHYSCYFNNGGELAKGDAKAMDWLRHFWGGKVPTVANFGKSAPIGWSSRSAV